MKLSFVLLGYTKWTRNECQITGKRRKTNINSKLIKNNKQQ